MIRVDIEKRLRTYNGWKILRVKREFAGGSITAIYGPSGTGKTTFLKVIAGFIAPEKGSIISGETSWLDTAKKITVLPQSRKIGFVFQDYALFPNMTVMEHLRYATGDENWIGRLLRISKLDNLVDHKPVYLSGGQQQRLAIIRALATKPALLLMDEPFSALDHEMKDTLVGELKILFAELSLTVILVSHNRQELQGIYTSEFELKAG